MKPICLIPKLQGLGGMVSFQAKLIHGLEARGIPYTFDLNQRELQAVLVIGGTRQLLALHRARRRGARIIQRLNGMNWLHRVQKTPLKAALRAEINNRILAFIRRHLADGIIYQSQFSQDWWNRVYQKRSIPTSVAYNGVDLAAYTPQGPEMPPSDHFRILLVEGHLRGAYARGLDTAVRLAKAVQENHHLPVELMVVGDVGKTLIEKTKTQAPEVKIRWHGVVPREQIPAIDRSAHVLFSADLNAACPNSVIEALACGLPVVAYDTGALGELVQHGAGEVVPYGSDYWHLEEPVIQPLASACAKILQENASYRKAARLRAEKTFGLDTMVDAYLKALTA